MKQNLFVTKQVAEELLKEAIAIWRQSNRSEHLEEMENDPVISLLMTALAYQFNEIDNEIEQLKTEVLEDFTRMLIPYELCHATPATAVVETALQEDIPEVNIDSNTSFTLANSNFNFIPLLKTRVLNWNVKSVVRIDARRWKVSFTSKFPISDLSKVSFCILNQNFQDLKILLNGRSLPLIKPWDYSNLPLSSCFSLDTMLYNKSMTYNATSAWFDLFAQQNVRMFCVDLYQAFSFISMATENIDLIFEFSGINEDFVFDKTQLVLNSTILVNAKNYSVMLSSASPITRIVGDGSQVEGGDTEQLLHVIRPSEEQIYRDSSLVIRRAAVNRFNADSLVRLINCLVNKFSSDFYAFQEFTKLRNGQAVYQLREILKNMSDEVGSFGKSTVAGVYLMLEGRTKEYNEHESLEVHYLVTNGAAVNKTLNIKSMFSAPSGFLTGSMKQICEPVLGRDEIRGMDAQLSLSQYYFITNDRIVTPADIKIFCYNELFARYGISLDMIESLKVKNRQSVERNHVGHKILVDILLKDDIFVKRSFADKIAQVEFILQKMIEVRSANIYPIQVSIRIL